MKPAYPMQHFARLYIALKGAAKAAGQRDIELYLLACLQNDLLQFLKGLVRRHAQVGFAVRGGHRHHQV